MKPDFDRRFFFGRIAEEAVTAELVKAGYFVMPGWERERSVPTFVDQYGKGPPIPDLLVFSRSCEPMASWIDVKVQHHFGQNWEVGDVVGINRDEIDKYVEVQRRTDIDVHIFMVTISERVVGTCRLGDIMHVGMECQCKQCKGGGHCERNPLWVPRKHWWEDEIRLPPSKWALLEGAQWKTSQSRVIPVG